MVNQFIRWKRFIRASNKGFTLLELIVTLLVASILLGVSLSFIVDQRKLFVDDKDRTQINQNLRAAIDLVGTDIKQAGERIFGIAELPVVRVIDGTSDELFLQRLVITQVLPVCETATIAQNSTQETIDVSVVGGVDDCNFSDGNGDGLPDNLGEWQDARHEKDGDSANNRNTNVPQDGCFEQGGSDEECLWAYIYDPVEDWGEFFLYSFEAPDGTGNRYRIYRARSANVANNRWQNAYDPANNPRLYILEEHHYQLVDNPRSNDPNDQVLQLVINGQTTQPIRLVNQLSNFQVQVEMQDGSTKTDFNQTTPFNDDWQQIQSIQVNLTDRDSSQTISSNFFPRNIMSR